MKLSSKVLLGFVLTNAIYILLLALVFIFVRPVEVKSGLLSQYVIPVTEAAAGINRDIGELPSNMRAFLNSPNNDRKYINKLHELVKEIERDIEIINRVLASPEAAILQTTAITEPFKGFVDAYRQYMELALPTPDRRDKILALRNELLDDYYEAIQGIKDVLKAEEQTLESELASDDLPAIRRRIGRIATINTILDSSSESYVTFLRGYLGQDHASYNRSLAVMSDAQKVLADIISTTRVQMHREALGAAQKIIAEKYAPIIKQVTAMLTEDVAIAVKRTEVSEAAMEHAFKFNYEVEAITRAFTGEMGSAVTRVVAAMAIGAVVALIVSLIMAAVLTRGIVGPINQIINSLSESAHEVDGASSQLTGASNTLAEGATENAASLEETSAALEELSSMTKRNADNAVEANGLMAQANEAVHKAEDSMVKVISAMEEISRSGNEIGKIIKTIDEIAFQTNLLALNAAVEAARAGEAGAGFAVVADEVRNLAIRSAEAAKNTADLIASTIANINSGSEMVNATAENFKIVETHSSKVAQLVSEVAEASKEQSSGIGQINTAMSEMDKVTQSNAATAEEAASAAGQLSLQAGNLLSAVNEMEVLAHGAEGRPSGGHSPRLAVPSAKASAKGRPAADKALPMADDSFDF